MKWFFFLPILFLLSSNLLGQTRFFISGGANTTTQFIAEPNLNLGLSNNSISAGAVNQDNSFGKYLRLGLTIEKRLFGPYYWLTGFKINQAGYNYTGSNSYTDTTTKFASALKNTYFSVPLMVRINLFNANTLYLDFGLMENILVDAKLKESVQYYSYQTIYQQYSDQRNITKYLSRFSTSFYFEMGFAVRRFGISAFFQSNAFGSSTDFSGHWNIPRDQSYFLLYFQNFYYQTKGINLTYRIR